MEGKTWKILKDGTKISVATVSFSTTTINFVINIIQLLNFRIVATDINE